MALFRAISQKDDCSCECCMIREEMEEVQMDKDNLARAKLKLRLLGFAKPGKDKEVTPWEKTDRRLLLLTEDECKNLVSWARYTGNPPTAQQVIQSMYPSHELIIEMDDGRVFTLNTDSYSLDIIVGRYIDLDAYFEHIGFRDGEDRSFIYEQTAAIRIPGAKNIYYMEC